MNRSKKLCRSAGFTILELMVVIVIIGILAVVAMPRVFNARDRGHVGAAQYDLTAIRHALAAYAADHNGYPPSAASYEVFKRKLVDTDGNPYITWPSGETFRWISYVNGSLNIREEGYLLVIQALDQRETMITATADGIQISP